ncbi:MAG: LAGLIDADG family homing endonuclease [Candidatus Aenigmatarchaeota archaeon]
MENCLNLYEISELSVGLEEKFRKEFFDEALVSFGSQYKLAGYLGVGQFTVSRWFNGKFLIPVKTLLKINESVKMDTRLIEVKVIRIGSAQGSLPVKRSLPIAIDGNLAYLMGLIITDGHIDKNLAWVEFVNNQKYLRSIFMENIEKIFNHKNFYIYQKNEMQVYVKNKTISTIFHELGIPKGKKFDIVEVPEKIKKSSIEIKKCFLRGCFDGDGSVAYTKRQGLRIVNYATSSRKMAEGISEILRELEIRNSVIKNKNDIYYINITGRDEIEKFQRLVDFKHPKRSEKLEEILNSYKKPS